MQDKRDVYLSQDHVCSITPTEFEKYCEDILLGYAEEEKLPNFAIKHNTKQHAYDGTYQIDLCATFTALGSNFKVICECKQYKSPVKREKVVILADKIKSLGAHKGILLSTSRFQSGAIQYAGEHGIALIQVYDNKIEFYAHSNGAQEYDENDPLFAAEKKLPPYKAILFTGEADKPVQIYPSRSMIETIYLEMSQQMKEKYGITIDFTDIKQGENI